MEESHFKEGRTLTRAMDWIREIENNEGIMVGKKTRYMKDLV